MSAPEACCSSQLACRACSATECSHCIPGLTINTGGAHPRVCSMTSGAIQQGVPTKVLRATCWLPHEPPRSMVAATPKSATTTVPSSLSRMLPAYARAQLWAESTDYAAMLWTEPCCCLLIWGIVRLCTNASRSAGRPGCASSAQSAYTCPFCLILWKDSSHHAAPAHAARSIP